MLDRGDHLADVLADTQWDGETLHQGGCMADDRDDIAGLEDMYGCDPWAEDCRRWHAAARGARSDAEHREHRRAVIAGHRATEDADGAS